MLGLVRGSNFYGIVGTKTKAEFNGEPICVGDIVVAAEGENVNQSRGPVAIFTTNAGILGRVSNSVDNDKITMLVASHKELKAGDTVADYFTVVEMHGIA